MEAGWAEHSDMTQAFVATNIALALLIAFWMKITTPRASLARALHDPQAMWDMIRRGFYISIACGPFGMAWWTAAGWITPSRAEIAFWLMVTVPITLFLALRARGAINADRWMGFRRAPPQPRDLYDIADDYRDVASGIRDPDRKSRAMGLASELEHAANGRWPGG